MFSRSCNLVSAIILGLVLVPGCGQSQSDNDANPEKPSNKKSPAPKENDSPKKKKQADKQPQSADAAVEAVFAGIRNKQPEALWAFLPASYQHDVNGLFHLLAERMDPELWNRTIAVGRRIVKLCRERKATILDTGLIQPTAGADEKALSAEWDAAVSLAGTLLQSDLTDLEKMKDFDGGAFLASTGGQFMNKLAEFSRLLPGNTFQVELNDLANRQAKLVSETEDTAVVELSFRDDDTDPQRVPFVRVEGKWIPRKLTDGWKADIAAMRKRIEQQLAPKVLAEKKKQFFKSLAVVEKSLDDLEAAKTPAEFQKRFGQSAVASIVLGYFRAATRRGKTPGVSVIPKDVEKKAKPGKRRRITVIVQSPLDRAAAGKIADKLFDLTTDADVGDVSINAKQTRFPVTTAVSFAAFQKAIQFARIVSADETKREIVIKLK